MFMTFIFHDATFLFWRFHINIWLIFCVVQISSERNEAYDKLLTTKVDSDNYISKSAQTISRGVSETNKSKAVQANKPPCASKEVNVSRHVISDAFATPEKPLEQQLLEQCSKESQTIASSVLKQTGYCVRTLSRSLYKKIIFVFILPSTKKCDLGICWMSTISVPPLRPTCLPRRKVVYTVNRYTVFSTFRCKLRS